MGIIFYFLLFTVAFLYASVGHGGASGYLALLSFYGFQPNEMKETALVLNVCVSMISFLFYNRNQKFNLKLFLILIVFSMPFAFIGAKYNFEIKYYKKILGILLLFPIARLLGFASENQTERAISVPLAAISSSIIGFLSGIIGIGGGILLSPFLILMGWTTIKEASSIAALYIFFNSLSGLLGLMKKGLHLNDHSFTILTVAVVGGILGGYLGSHKFELKILRQLLALVMFIASIKLIFT